ncbi:MAG TPA: RDD family protein [Dyella sp.]|uniref:RDD family protein n=1 Tax=Dyella sp. TaxID=1869338 RepID=UPI002D0017DE|nr:RDD family protein [Dyella sp.]HTV87224.1 RDD family protein [Dyella sp.]
MIPANTTDVVCPLWRRLMALLYDVVAVIAIVMVVGLLCQLATHGQLIATGGQVRIAPWYQPLQALVVAAYFVVSWRRGGQTLGMRPWRIRVTARNGAQPSLLQACVRVMTAALPLLLLLLAPALGLHVALWALAATWTVWFAVALFDSRRRTMHDLAARTEIRRIG